MIKALGTNHINTYRNSFRGDSNQIGVENSKSQPSAKFKSEKKQIYTYAYTIAAIAAIASLAFGSFKSLQKQLTVLADKITNMEKIITHIPGATDAAKKAGVNFIS